MCQGALDCDYHAFDIAEDLGICEAQYAVTSFEHEFITVDVTVRSHIVRMAVQLNDELALATQKVREEWSDRHLSAELCPKL